MSLADVEQGALDVVKSAEAVAEAESRELVNQDEVLRALLVLQRVVHDKIAEVALSGRS